jgi:hypothetical protein
MNPDENSQVQDTLFLAGGLALMVVGAGLLLARPSVRRTITGGLAPLLPEGPLANRVGGVLPDLERYLKLKSM